MSSQPRCLSNMYHRSKACKILAHCNSDSEVMRSRHVHEATSHQDFKWIKSPCVALAHADPGTSIPAILTSFTRDASSILQLEPTKRLFCVCSPSQRTSHSPYERSIPSTVAHRSGLDRKLTDLGRGCCPCCRHGRCRGAGRGDSAAAVARREAAGRSASLTRGGGIVQRCASKSPSHTAPVVIWRSQHRLAGMTSDTNVST